MTHLIDALDEIDTGTVLITDSDVVEVAKNDIVYRNHEYQGKLIVDSLLDGNRSHLHIGKLFHAVDRGDIQRVPDRAAENPSGVLLDFAEKELTNYSQDLSLNHDYNGIDGVESIADLVAAFRLKKANA